jgi:alkylation response protein AidB-like acyl-CoA dehydrogenase
VPQETSGYHAQTISGKLAARVLQATRLGVAWAGIGHCVAVYETAVHYAAQRVQFGRPLAKSQIVQSWLAEMLSELTSLQTLLMQFTRQEELGELSGPAASLENTPPPERRAVSQATLEICWAGTGSCCSTVSRATLPISRHCTATRAPKRFRRSSLAGKSLASRPTRSAGVR